MKTFGKFLWLLLLFMTSQISGLVIGFTMVPSQLNGQTYNPGILAQAIIAAATLGSLYLVWIFAKAFQFPLPDLKKWTLKDSAFALAIAAVTTLYARAGLYLMEYYGLGGTANDLALDEIFANISFPVVFLIVVVCGPIMEEWVFRAGIIGFLFEKYPLIGVGVSSLVFGALHMPSDWISWAIYGGLGLIFSLVYYKTKRLELVMAMHMLHNLAAITI